MFDDLSQVKRRYEELAYRMTTPEAMNDPAAYAAMMREYKELTPLVEALSPYCNTPDSGWIFGSATGTN